MTPAFGVFDKKAIETKHFDAFALPVRAYIHITGTDKIRISIMPLNSSTIIAQTSQWIHSVVIGCNFCPFAAKAILRKSIRYVVLPEASLESALEAVVEELRHLDQTEAVETTLLIFPEHFSDFEDYLDLVDLAEDLSVEQGYEGVYQIASFHPAYCFAGAADEDPTNYTNRSPYPMLHLLREDSITKAVAHYKDPEGIPERNMAYAQAKGLKYMQALQAACLIDFAASSGAKKKNRK